MAFPATTWTPATLAPRLGAKPDDPEVARVLGVAVEVLTEAAVVTFRTIPASVADEMTYRVARGLWENRRQQHGGGQLTQVPGEGAVRPPRDPLAPVTPLLARYVVPL